jgi:hypothetical protein
MGSALSQALTEALRERGQTAPISPSEFSKVFTRIAGISGMNCLVSLDTLTQRIADAVQALQTTQVPYTSAGKSSWAATMFTSTEVVYGVTGTDVTELPEYGVSP